MFRRLGFTLRAGEAMHLIGPNGAGKTSLLRLLAGLATPFAGSVQRSGTIGLLDDRLTLEQDQVLRNALAFWFDLSGSCNLDQVIEAFDLAQLQDIPVRYLSTGQRKRAAFAQLSSQGSDIWLLDEPLSGLDGDNRDRIEHAIGQHLSDGGLCIVASHQAFARVPMTALALPDFA